MAVILMTRFRNLIAGTSKLSDLCAGALAKVHSNSVFSDDTIVCTKVQKIWGGAAQREGRLSEN